MASSSQIKRDVGRVLGATTVTGTNPISTLCTAVKAEGVKGRDMVMGAINHLERQGSIRVVRFQGKITSIGPRPERLHVDRTEMSAQQKRERTFAKDVPAFLPDSMCGPVVITYMEPKPTPEVQPETVASTPAMPELVYTEGGSFADNLNVCLFALRLAADENGMSTQTVSTVLHEVEGMNKSRLMTVMDVLRDSFVTVHPKHGYVVKMTGDITAELVGEIRRAKREAEKASTTDAVVTQQADNAQLLGEAIVMMEEQLQEAERVRVHSDERIATLEYMLEQTEEERVYLSGRVTELEAALARQLQVNAELQCQLDSAPVLDPKVAAILARRITPAK